MYDRNCNSINTFDNDVNADDDDVDDDNETGAMYDHWILWFKYNYNGCSF